MAVPNISALKKRILKGKKLDLLRINESFNNKRPGNKDQVITNIYLERTCPLVADTPCGTHTLFSKRAHTHTL